MHNLPLWLIPLPLHQKLICLQKTNRSNHLINQVVQPLYQDGKITIPTRPTLIQIGIQVSFVSDDSRLNLLLRFNFFCRIQITNYESLLFQLSEPSNQWMNHQNNQSRDKNKSWMNYQNNQSSK